MYKYSINFILLETEHNSWQLTYKIIQLETKLNTDKKNMRTRLFVCLWLGTW